jgi:hypothetical protein
MTLFYLKLIVTPLLMWAVSLASRRWGGLLGGLLSGLPITSALVMTFLCLEQGTAFVLGAVPGALGGLAAVQATYAFYLYITRRFGIAGAGRWRCCVMAWRPMPSPIGAACPCRLPWPCC